MSIHELISALKNRGELIRQEIVTQAEQLTRLIQPYADKMGYSRYNLDLIRGENPIGNTWICSILLEKKEGNKFVCWFLQSDGGGLKTGDLQVTMACQPAEDGTNPLSFETIEVYKLPLKEKRRWFPLKPANQLKNLKLANECLGAL